VAVTVTALPPDGWTQSTTAPGNQRTPLAAGTNSWVPAPNAFCVAELLGSEASVRAALPTNEKPLQEIGAITGVHTPVGALNVLTE
jgi:hypothetical protein